MVLICISLTANDGEHIFISLYPIHISCLVKCLWMSFADFLIGLFLYCSVSRVLADTFFQSISDNSLDMWHLFTCGFPIDPVLFVKKTILPPMKCFCSSVKNQLAVLVWGNFWVLYSVPLVYTTANHSLNHCSDILSLIIR